MRSTQERPRTALAAPWPVLHRGPAGAGGYQRLCVVPGEAYHVRRDLGGPAPSLRLRPIAAFVHVSDLHVTDAQSPARAEYLARLGDDDFPLAGWGSIGTYRPQESLTAHVVEAMVRSLRRVDTGPVTGAPVSFAVSTGDAADNAQANEIETSIRLLGGGLEVVPDSGDPSRWEGVGTAATYDRRYWHPDGTPNGEGDDRARARFGFPEVPGLLDAARRPFTATGLGVPWYPVYGNHDALLAGTIAPNAAFERVARGRRKPLAWPRTLDVAPLAARLASSGRCPPDVLSTLAAGPVRFVTPDRSRGPLSARSWLAAHAGRGAAPASAATWYAFDEGAVRGLVLDTVNHAGGWQGSISVDQLQWLEEQLRAASDRWVDERGRLRRHGVVPAPVLLFSHHPLRCLVNDWCPDGGRRALAEDVEALLARYPCVVAWVNGHTHEHRVLPHPRDPRLGGGWWEVTTASHVDWPQQARIVELAEDVDGGVVVACSVVDHAGTVLPERGRLGDVVELAGWSRELAANDWQRRDGDGGIPGRGRCVDRNVVLASPPVERLELTVA